MLITDRANLIPPYGEKLVDLMASAESYDDLKEYASRLPSIQISANAVCDLEMLAIGAYSPLDRFMSKVDYESVLNEKRLENGYLFPLPITLPVNDHYELHLDSDVAIRNSEFELMGIITIEEIYDWDQENYLNGILGERDIRHPIRTEIHRWGSVNISGRIQVLQLPRHYDFQDLWLTPSQTRVKLNQFAYQNVVAIQPNSSILPDLREINIEELEKIDGSILLQLAVGMPKTGDFEYFNQVRTYRDVAKQYLDPDRFLISLQPSSTQLSSPRQVLLQALIHRNYGANYLYLVGNQLNKTTSAEDGLHNLLKKFSYELEMKIVPSPEPVVNQAERRSNGNSRGSRDTRLFVPNETTNHKNVGKSQFYKFQQAVIKKLGEAQPPSHERGVCIWFTGLSGSGKSTTAEILAWSLLEHDRKVTVLDGDVVRTHLSKGLGFSKEDRDTNVRRIGFVASELVRLGGVVICAVVSPYRDARNDVRNMVGKDQFVEVYVNTPLDICESRDVKGFYAKARRNEIQGFTGIDDPYEAPEHPEITLDAVGITPQDNARFIVEHLTKLGFILDGKKTLNLSRRRKV